MTQTFWLQNLLLALSFLFLGFLCQKMAQRRWVAPVGLYAYIQTIMQIFFVVAFLQTGWLLGVLWYFKQPLIFYNVEWPLFLVGWVMALPPLTEPLLWRFFTKQNSLNQFRLVWNVSCLSVFIVWIVL